MINKRERERENEREKNKHQGTKESVNIYARKRKDKRGGKME